MKALPNTQLTRNFHLYEFIEAQLPFEAVALNWKYITRFDMLKWEEMALELEKDRRLINEHHKPDLFGFDDIGIRITSGFRCIEWELLRGRSGLSQHTICAVDYIPTNVSRSKAIVILKWLYDIQDKTWPGGLAIKHPEQMKTGFIHKDTRKELARWNY